MRRIWSLATVSVLLLAACSPDTTAPDGRPERTNLPAIMPADGDACTAKPASEIEANLTLLMAYVVPNDNSTLGKFQQVKDALAAGDYALAQTKLQSLIDFINLKYGQLSTLEQGEVITELDPEKTVAEFKDLVVADLICFASFDLNPGDPAKVFTNDVDSAGVYFPAGYVPVGFNVAITTPAAEALVTKLDKYPSYIDIQLLDADGNPPGPGTPFNTANGRPVVVVCFPSGLSNEVYDRLLLGHQASDRKSVV
jgi:hypothetical protein